MVNVHIHQFPARRCSGGRRGACAVPGVVGHVPQARRKRLPGPPRGERSPPGNLEWCFPVAFCFLDIACGDASTMKAALRGTQVRHYHGIDLSQAALDLATANLVALPFGVDLDHRAFVEAMMRGPEHADATWCSLSIHHLSTDDKLHLMKAIRAATGARGI